MFIRRLAAICLLHLATVIAGCGGGPVTTPQQAPPPISVDPSAAFSAPASATVLDPVALDASASASSDGSALQYSWDFGGGERGGDSSGTRRVD